jgi:hypothetical protein
MVNLDTRCAGNTIGLKAAGARLAGDPPPIVGSSLGASSRLRARGGRPTVASLAVRMPVISAGGGLAVAAVEKNVFTRSLGRGCANLSLYAVANSMSRTAVIRDTRSAIEPHEGGGCRANRVHRRFLAGDFDF